MYPRLNVRSLSAVAVAAAGAWLPACSAGSDLPNVATSSSALAAASAAERRDAGPEHPLAVEYVGVGDSIPFGDNDFIPYTRAARPDPEAFIGYADIVGKNLFGGQYRNIACPGETSSHMDDIHGADHGCGGYRQALSLKVDYAGSQLDELVSLVEQNPRLKAITLTIGANDFFALEDQCARSHGKPGEAAACVQAAFPAVVRLLASNVEKVWTRAKAAGFTGKLAFVNVYSTDYSDVSLNRSVLEGNEATRKVTVQFGGVVVDAYSALEQAAKPFGGDACKGGLLVANPIRPTPAGEPACGVHLSARGASIVAGRVIEALR